MCRWSASSYRPLSARSLASASTLEGSGRFVEAMGNEATSWARRFARLATPSLGPSGGDHFSAEAEEPCDATGWSSCRNLQPDKNIRVKAPINPTSTAARLNASVRQLE